MEHYHNFVIIGSSSSGQKERCDECGFEKVYKQIGGRFNEREYLKDHTRDFAQPNGQNDKLFKKYYGNYK